MIKYIHILAFSLTIHFLFSSTYVMSITMKNNDQHYVENQLILNNPDRSNNIHLDDLNFHNLLDILDRQICPKHVNNNISYCLQNRHKCETSYYLVNWIYYNLKKGTPSSLIINLLDQEINNSMTLYYSKIFQEDYNSKGMNIKPDVIIINYSDFECPHCKKVSKLVDILYEQYPNNIKIIYKHFPISFHKNAKILAMIAESCRTSENFIKFHHALKNKNIVNYINIYEIIKECEFNVCEIRQQTFNKKTYCKLSNSLKESRIMMISGVPTMFFNNYQYHLNAELFSLKTQLEISRSIK